MLTKQKNITVAVLYNNKLLLLKRGASAPWMPNKYCLPGGGIDNNESIIDAAIRELYEETGIITESKNLTSIKINDYISGKIAFIYQPSTFPNVVLNYEHSGYAWNSVSEVYSRNDTVPSVKKVVDTLVYWGFFI